MDESFFLVLFLSIGICLCDEPLDICKYGEAMGNPQVNTTSGLVTGVTTENVHIFWGIPYAQPPLGNLRFQPPEPISIPLKEINATKNNFLQCLQVKGAEHRKADGPCPVKMSEDCLILNIFVPSGVNLATIGTQRELLPVLFFIHGGSFKAHSGNQPRHDATELANATNTIVVTINYRLGPLGFLMHRQPGEPDIVGNQGLKDQQLAMRWVQKNIEQFGGDKRRVTIFGNSAGAQSVMFHTLSNVSKNLFANSIQQSNPAVMSFIAPTIEMSLRITDRLIQSMDCKENERKCLMDAPAQVIVGHTSTVEMLTYDKEGTGLYLSETFQPVVDEVEFTEQPIVLFQNGKWNKDKNMMIGISTQEFEMGKFSVEKGHVVTQEEFVGTMLQLFNMDTVLTIGEKYSELHKLEEDDNYMDIIWKIYSDYYFICPSRFLARLAAKTTSSAVYYFVNDRKVVVGDCVDKNEGNKTGCYVAYHASEIEYIFRTVKKVRNDNYTLADLYIENLYSTYWGDFARTGTPSEDSGNILRNYPVWPEYKEDKDPSKSWKQLLIKSPPSKITSRYHEDICDFWDGIGYVNVNDDGHGDNETVTEVEPTSQVETTSGTERMYIAKTLVLFCTFVVIWCSR